MKTTDEMLDEIENTNNGMARIPWLRSTVPFSREVRSHRYISVLPRVRSMKL